MKACVFTLGCKMNEVESMSLMQGLEARGFEVTDVPEYADLYLLNTCAVTAEAERKSRQAVTRLRKYNSEAPVIVCAARGTKRKACFANCPYPSTIKRAPICGFRTVAIGSVPTV